MAELKSPRPFATAALSIAIAISVLARGGVTGTAQALVLGATGVAFLAASFLPAARFRVPALVLGLTVALAAAILQLVPLPPYLLGALSPSARDVADVALAPLGLYPAARPSTLDIPATAREVGKAAALLAAGAAAVLLGARTRSRDTVVAVVSGTGVVAVVVVLGGALFGDAPWLGSGGPFVNPNHLAAFLALAAWPALGRGLREKGLLRAGWLLAFAVTGAGIFLTLSRGGIAAFFVGAAVFALLNVRRKAARAPEGTPLSRLWIRHAAPPVASSLALAAAAFLALDPALEAMRSVANVASDPRTEIWPEAIRMLAGFPLLGVGRGAFEAAFTGYHRGQTLSFTYTHVENEWLQLPLDLGVPLGIAVVGALAWAWFSSALRRHHSRVEIGALAGTAAVAANAFVDFGLELPGVALPFAVLLGVLSGDAKGVSLRPTVFRAGAITAAMAGAIGLWLSAAHPSSEIDALASEQDGDLVSRARAIAAWRPADYLPHAVVGARLVEDGRCRDAMQWLTRAMWLAPSVPEPHRLAARCLAASHQDVQARREYRLAHVLGDGSALEEAIKRWTDAEALLQLVPETPEAIGQLAFLLDLRGRRAEAAEVLDRGALTFPDLDLIYRLGVIRSQLGDNARALELARDLRTREPGRARSYVLAALALGGLGDADGALRELDEGLACFPGSPEIVLALAHELMRQKRFARATSVLASAAWRSPGDAARGRRLLIGALRAQGRISEALVEARSARDLDPRNAAITVLLAEVLAEARLFDEAAGVLAAAESLPGADRAAIAGKLEKVRAAARERAERILTLPRDAQ